MIRPVVERAQPLRPQTDRYQGAWRRLLGFRGELPAVNASIELETDRPEYGFPKGEYLFSFFTAPAFVAQTPVLGVFNPLGSSVICTVTQATATLTAVNSDLELLVNDTDVTGGGVAILPRDTRWFRGTFGAVGRGPGVRGGFGIAFPGGNVYRIDRFVGGSPALTRFEFRHLPAVLAPGSGLYIVNNGGFTGNVHVAMSGYIRSADTAELSTPG